MDALRCNISRHYPIRADDIGFVCFLLVRNGKPHYQSVKCKSKWDLWLVKVDSFSL